MCLKIGGWILLFTTKDIAAFFSSFIMVFIGTMGIIWAICNCIELMDEFRNRINRQPIIHPVSSPSLSLSEVVVQP